VDSGFSCTNVAPFVRGVRSDRAVRRVDVGGKALTNALKDSISYRQIDVSGETFVVNQMKEDVSFVSDTRPHTRTCVHTLARLLTHLRCCWRPHTRTCMYTLARLLTHLRCCWRPHTRTCVHTLARLLTHLRCCWHPHTCTVVHTPVPSTAHLHFVGISSRSMTLALSPLPPASAMPGLI
jgi:hypothetical protein